MWCLVSQPNNVILEVEVDSKAKGQQCLEKVCQSLGIGKEEDYFGLKYLSPKGEELWLNLRNQIDRQVAGPPYRFALRVKFWVPPHLILQDATRHQFFLHARLELLENRLKVPDCETMARVIALVAQAEASEEEIPSSLMCLCAGAPSDLYQRVAMERAKLQGMKQSAAEYWLLKEVSNFETFGQELFGAKTRVGLGKIVGVGPHGVSLVDVETGQANNIPYTAIQRASSMRRSLHVYHLEGAGASVARLELKLDSSQAATGLYRCITEKHAFYSCETVRSAVTSQFIRDLKGTIVSIFNEDTSLGKKYVFDIRRTCREVYDNARRALYLSGEMPNVELQEPDLEGSSKAQVTCSNPGSCLEEECKSSECKASRDQLSEILDAILCCICMDKNIDTAFFPCRHAISCIECASRCDRCPLCRADITEVTPIYLPSQLRVRPSQVPIL
ncbi:E3 ubiquitin-protein ligase MYLIP [Neocloeon triangulifer]|uniref:E3 ubiquitin-protein ligase MYLIP n=1 Tax=Neocloeon triangulifer TaxID=2078957 RepID=UPI00286FA9A3|nr:E3 ubiquitin-protein ligase MYLIP [Neocloeon triangulifer]